MPRGISRTARDLLTSEPLTAHLATCRDGKPHVAPVWYDVQGDTVEIVTTGRKLANIRENPKVALSVSKEDGPRAEWMVTVLGTATVVEDIEATEAATERINRRYDASEAAWPENRLVRIEVGTSSHTIY
jgi:PPOX class probable F420-dependent enzyme